jgi:hypothetical protein
MYVNGGYVIATMNILKSILTMEEILSNKGILKKLTKEGKVWPFIQLSTKLKP